ncbi:hypothetical protein SHDE107825_07540 [Shewanella denitrificans]
MRDSIFSLIFRGRSENISLWKWIKFLTLEIYLGEQLLEMISTTAAYNEGDQYKKRVKSSSAITINCATQRDVVVLFY